MLLALLVVLQAAPPSEKEADDAVRALRAETARADNPGKIAAAQAALAVLHERVVRAVADALTAEPDEVRIGVAGALAAADHPAAVSALVSALAANERRPAVARAICEAISALGWQKASPPLETYLKRSDSPDVRALLPDVIETLGELGATSSLPALLEFLGSLDGAKRDGGPGEGQARKAAETALRNLTGTELRRPAEYGPWWKANSTALLATARKTVWSKRTGERSVLLAAEKIPADAELVSVRIADPPAGKARPKKKKP
jgi:HEAT repeat protein